MRITNNQSWFDIAIKETGSIDSVFEIAAANNSDVTQMPDIDTTVVKPPVEDEQATKEYLDRNNVEPGTVGDPDIMSGIGFWAIESNFEVQ